MRRGPEALGGIFGGHVPSRGALEVVQKAIDLGIDPTRHVKATIDRTEAKGRSKVIVKPNNPLGDLRTVVMDRQMMRR